jgi:hypothetical protein
VKRTISVVWAICVVFLLSGNARSQTAAGLEPSSYPSLISALRIKAPLDFCGEQVPLDNEEVRERLEKQILLSLWNRAQVILWLKRSTRYFPHIEAMLKAHDMPGDLKYVAVVESALKPHATSRMKAVGFWQFLKSTGERYGLEITRFIDQRRNILYSTGAAIRYFKELYSIFGSWTLCAAAYNMGEDRLQARILTQEISDYYRLYIPLETQNFVPKIIAVKMILSNPKRYGFHLTKADYYPPLTFDRIELDCSRTTPLLFVAQAANTYFKVIKDLNPQIRGRFLRTGNHELLIPRGSTKGFHTRYKKILAKWKPKIQRRTYVVKSGDNLSSIAQRYGVSVSSLATWNNLKVKRPLRPGDRLVIYQTR